MKDLVEEIVLGVVTIIIFIFYEQHCLTGWDVKWPLWWEDSSF